MNFFPRQTLYIVAVWGVLLLYIQIELVRTQNNTICTAMTPSLELVVDLNLNIAAHSVDLMANAPAKSMTSMPMPNRALKIIRTIVN